MMRETLDAKGWSVITTRPSTEADLRNAIFSLVSHLGRIAPGRNRELIERIVPQTQHEAIAGSLSSQYGLNALPLHTDTAHWPIPCRYLVVGCLTPGPVSTPTILLDSRSTRLSSRTRAICHHAVFLIRNGRRSFYGHILGQERSFVRLDPGCMISLSTDGQSALDAFSYRCNEESLAKHEWTEGDMLIIDNWRVLHGRGNRESTNRARTLLRAMVL